MQEARRRIAALGDVHADAGVGDAAHELRRYAQSVDLLVVGSHKYRPIERVLEETTSQQLADEPSSPLLALAARMTAVAGTDREDALPGTHGVTASRRASATV